MNLCFTTGQLPKAWGTSEIFVLYKMKGSRTDPNSYRGINLINDFCRIFDVFEKHTLFYVAFELIKVKID